MLRLVSLCGLACLSYGYWKFDRPAPAYPNVGTWPNAIVPYEVSDEFTLTQRQKILSSIADLHRFSCVRFEPRRNALLLSTDDYVYFTPGQKKKCSSYVGRVGIGEQSLQLAPHCFQRSTILHELMHSLGFHHEHARRDRDDYVSILWPNVNPNFTNHFKIHLMGEHTYETPYDHSSVMHYDSLMGTGNGEPTILKKAGVSPSQQWGFGFGTDKRNSDKESWIKPAASLSLMDAARLNLLYGCDLSQCRNYYPRCDRYEKMGACYKMPYYRYMTVLCKLSCGGGRC